MTTFSERLKELRTEKRLDQTELAEATGISYSAIQKYEGGVNRPRSMYEQKIADFFGVSLAYLRGESDDRGDDISAYPDIMTAAEQLLSTMTLHDLGKYSPAFRAYCEQNITDRLEKLASLYDEGRLTAEEFSLAKKKVLGG